MKTKAIMYSALRYPTQPKGRGKIEATAKKIVRSAAAIILCYLAWKGASDFDNHLETLSYFIILGLVCLILFV